MRAIGLLAAQQDPAGPTSALAALADDPGWLMVLKAVVLFAFLVVLTLLTIWAERRIIGFMGMRLGPNRVGPFGMLQSLADGIKLALKEDVVPRGVDRPVYLLAPVISAGAALAAFAVIPFGPVVTLFGEQTPLQLADLPVSVLYLFAVASLGVYGVVLAGWASGSTYPLLGGLRSAAQMISYEIAMGLSFAGVFLFAGSLSTSEIVGAQNIWYAIVLFPSFAVYAISMVGETHRAPFDLPEAEGELVGGFHTEYSSLKFALFFLAEYINMATVSAIATTLFLGGWHAPWPLGTDILWAGANSGAWPVLWFLGKLLLMLFVFIWLRATLPRLRYDQFMALGWKVLIPLSLVWLLLLAVVRGLTNAGVGRPVIITAGLALALVALGATYAYELAVRRRGAAEPAGEADTAETESTPARAEPGGGHPVPPMDAPHYHGEPHRGRRGEQDGRDEEARRV